MQQRLTYFIMAVLACLTAASAFAASDQILTQQTTLYAQPDGLRWLDDPDGLLTPDEALVALQQGAGTLLDPGFPSLGFRRGPQWFLLRVDNQSSHEQWILQAGRPHLDYLDLYLASPDGQPLIHYQAGDRVPFSQRAIPHPELIFPLVLPAGQSQILLRAEGGNAIEMPLTLMTPMTFQQQDSQRQILHGIYYGSMLIMCLFNLLIFLSMRDPSFLLYVAYLGTLALNLFTRDGLAYQWLWPDSPWWNHHSLPVLNLLSVAFSILFACHFLQLSRYRPRLNRALRWIALLVACLAPLSLLNFHFWIQASTALALPWVLIIIFIAAIQAAQGHKAAYYFVLAFLVLSLAVTLYVLKVFQLLPGNWLLEHAIQFGAALEALLLSFALAHRMTTLKEENERIQREANEVLEQRVYERTQELNEALSARSEFLAVMSHEIRTPLNGIIGTLDLLRDSGLSSKQMEHMHVIEQSGNSLLQLINDVLDYARIEAGKMPLENMSFELTRLVEDCVALFQQRASLAGNSLHHAISAGLGGQVRGDPMRLRQVLVNLISNAVKFTENGNISVRVHREPGNSDYVRFEIEDDGIGIPEEKLPQLFEHFHQLDTSTSRRYGGTGLGLAICRQLVEMMGGQIGARSIDGQGSCFWFRMPLPRATEPALPAEPAPAQEPLPLVRLLIVDDNSINLMVAEGLCRKLGHQVEVASGGMEAIRLLLQDPRSFDLVLMDCEMPGMDGFATARQIIALQQSGQLSQFPIVALTAHAVPDKIRACHEAGMITHIAKPITALKLDHGLRAVLARGR